MSHIVQIQGDRPTFPANACVHCLRHATHEVEVVKVKQHVIRKVRVPFCDQCVALRQAKSSRQAQFERLAVVNSILLALASGAWVYTLISSEGAFRTERGEVWGLLLGILAALIVAGLLNLVVEPWARCFRSPETKAALRAVKIKAFDWGTTTLEFANQEYAEQFAQANQNAGRGDRTAQTTTAAEQQRKVEE
jgi:hypothetical protein